MCLISIRAAGPALIRLLSAAAVRIALSTILATPQPAIALQAIETPPAQTTPAQTTPVTLPPEQSNAKAVPRDQPAPMAGVTGAEPGFGWG
jgi:hypothetical protein